MGQALARTTTPAACATLAVGGTWKPAPRNVAQDAKINTPAGGARVDGGPRSEVDSAAARARQARVKGDWRVRVALGCAALAMRARRRMQVAQYRLSYNVLLGFLFAREEVRCYRQHCCRCSCFCCFR